MHIFDPDVNFACSGIIAQGMGPAVGAALSRKMRGLPGVAVAFVGEGAVNQGGWHEAMNLAAVWNLPFICVIEDNAWGISVAKETSSAVTNNADRAAAYGIPGKRVEGNDPYAIYEAAGEAIARARAGEGPSLLEFETYRLAGHFMGDAEGYRPKGEKDALFEKDPIPKMRARLLADGVASEDELTAIEGESAARVDAAITFARESADPAPEDALTRIFAA
ncbi:thiamine pyrophosphate-dependent dehydrogenase E1 component subunit alpha [Phaeobacter sp. J2-8]|uniref:thiamine pyrophosphate-dependent dehydrogenase E1 component subunit alpha n=1 Tax=Phaeobacter sp. J2-8 TaxID=2931394 RepID=UPI002455A10E|nr:thiamine pyrophosphate-dependent dehydrogenase E1 component subunit alpha [Phaeobacter sp. J2-8]